MAGAAGLVGFTASLVLIIVGIGQNPGRLILALLTGFVAVTAGWYVVTRLGLLRMEAANVAALAVAGLVWTVLSGRGHGLLLLLVLILVVVSVGCARYALGRDRAALRRLAPVGTRVPAARHRVLIMNPRSGGGKAERFHLVDEAKQRGIDPVLFQAGDDLRKLAEAALAREADVIGMAGGDGSQAVVAEVASAHHVPMVCIPAGTRNHFALDLGLDRSDVVGALDGFGDATEHTIDLAMVDGRVFVNNVSLGIYARIVQSPAYRNDKLRTAEEMLPQLLGPDTIPLDLRFTADATAPENSARLIQVSNNPYRLTRLAGFGSRARLDGGDLGVVATKVKSAAEEAELIAAEAAGRVSRFRGWHQWSTPTFEVRSADPTEAGIDGEVVTVAPPLRFRSLPGALRVRIPMHAPGLSPAAVAPVSR